MNLRLPATNRTVARDKLVGYANHFRCRVLQDALNEATAAYWIRRAETFDAVGNERCDEIALACRRRAALSLGGDLDDVG